MKKSETWAQAAIAANLMGKDKESTPHSWQDVELRFLRRCAMARAAGK